MRIPRIPDPFADFPYWFRVALGVAMGLLIGFAYLGSWLFGTDGGALGFLGMLLGIYLPPHLPEHDKKR